MHNDNIIVYCPGLKFGKIEYPPKSQRPDGFADRSAMEIFSVAASCASGVQQRFVQ